MNRMIAALVISLSYEPLHAQTRMLQGDGYDGIKSKFDL